MDYTVQNVVSPPAQHKRIGNFDSLLFSLIIETAMLKLKIMDGCAKLYSQKRAEQNEQDELTTQNRVKRKHDSDLVKHVLKSTLIQLMDSGDWLDLRRYVCLLTQNSVKLESLNIDHEHLKQSRIGIIKEIRSKRKQYQQELRVASSKITELKDKMQNETCNSAMRLSYADKWLNSKLESLELQLATPAPLLPRVDHEERVHVEINKVYELQTQEREKLVEHWRFKYAEDTADINQRIADVKEKLQVAVARRNELQALFDLHAGEMRSWLTFKAERAARLAREERRRASAVPIQAWWRGVMVRRGLGQFKMLKNNARKTPVKNKKK